MKQLKVALPDDLRSKLENAAEASGRSLADEVRRRLEESFARDLAYDAATDECIRAVPDLAALVSVATGHKWHQHAAAHWAFRSAIKAWLQRRRPAGDRAFAPGDLPKARLVSSDDPEAIGLALETLHFHTSSLTPEQLRRVEQMKEKSIRDLEAKHPDLKWEKKP